jgi:hypothetical protein
MKKIFFLVSTLTASFCFAQSKNETGKIIVTIIDSTTQQPTPVRVRVTRNGHVVNNLPREAIAVMYGVWDHADGYGFQPDSSFYADGHFEMELPKGEYEMSISKGIEYLNIDQALNVTPSAITRKAYTIKRWIDMPSIGWFSADDHIHVRRSPREDSLLMKWIQAEDVHVGVLLKMGDFWSTYFDQYAWGSKGAYRSGNYM